MGLGSTLREIHGRFPTRHPTKHKSLVLASTCLVPSFPTRPLHSSQSPQNASTDSCPCKAPPSPELPLLPQGYLDEGLSGAA